MDPEGELGAERLLDDDAERAVVAFPAAGDDAVRDLFLERQGQDIEEGRSAGRRVPFDETQEKRRRHREREVAADRERRSGSEVGDDGAKVQLERVSGHHAQVFVDAPLLRVFLDPPGQPRVHLDGQHPGAGREQREGERPLAGPDFDDGPRFSGAERRSHEALRDRPVVEKILPPRPGRKNVTPSLSPGIDVERSGTGIVSQFKTCPRWG